MTQESASSDNLSVKRSALSVERSAPILAARSLAKTYLTGTQRLQVLRDVSLTVVAGESVSIRGESGSG